MQLHDNITNAQILENAVLSALYHIYDGHVTDKDLKPLRQLLRDTKKLNEYLDEIDNYLSMGT